MQGNIIKTIRGEYMYDEERPTKCEADQAYKDYTGEYPAEEPIRVGSHLPLSQQEKAVAELHDVIGRFASRLKPVLTPSPEAAERNASDADKVAPMQSPLAEQMSANNRGVYRATEKLRALMERLEC